MKKRNILDSPRLLGLKKEKNQIMLKKAYIFLFLFILLVPALSLLSRWEKLNIINVEINGNKVIDKSILENLIKEKISGNYLFVFPKRNFIFYPKQDIQDELRAKFKRLSHIELDLKDFQTLSVNVTERTALYTWCGDTPFTTQITEENQDETIEKTASPCYFMDDTGYIFDKAPYFSGEVYLKFYGVVEKEDDTSIGFSFKEKDFNNLIFYKKEFEKMGLKLASFFVDENADIRSYLSSTSSSIGPELIFKSSDTPSQIVANLDATLSTEPLLSNFKSKYNSLLYIDMRFGNKVYYKFSEE